MVRSFSACAALSLLAASASAQFTYTGVGPGFWGSSDADLGIAGALIEDFEDLTLIPGLKVGVESALGNRAPTGTIPTLFNNSLDTFGSAFFNGTWDGSYGLVSTRDNLAHAYAEAGNWGTTIFQIEGGASLFGFSIQQMDTDATLIINGKNVGTLGNLFAIKAFGGGRNGYCRINATGDELITEVRIANNGNGDGYMFDHVAVVPAPGAVTLLGIGALAAGRRRR